MSDIEHWKLQSGYHDCWPSWKRHDIVSVGWDIGDVQKIHERAESTSAAKQVIKERLDDKYGNRDDWSEGERNAAAGAIRSVAGIRGNTNRNFTKGDTVVILGKPVRGESVVHGIAEIGEYVYDKYEVTEDDHPYQREATYHAKGPVRIKDLPEEFHDLQFRGTLQEYKDAGEATIDFLINAINRIVGEQGPVEPREQYFDYDIISESDLQKYIREHYSRVDDRIVDIKREHTFGDDTRVDHICMLEQGEILGIETKLETAAPEAVKQLVSYLENIAVDTDDGTGVEASLSQKTLGTTRYNEPAKQESNSSGSVLGLISVVSSSSYV